MKRKLEQPDGPGSKKTNSPADVPSVSHAPIPMPLLYPYHNHRTFVHLNNSLTIPADDLIVLDGYAFSIAELTENAAANLKDFYRNPHIIQADENSSFSDEAIRQLRLHPVLSVLAAELDGKLALQKNGISEETIDAVLNLLNKLAADSDVIADQAERDFSRYFFSLPNVEQNQLNEYLIYLPTTLGGHQTLKFEAALVGGDMHSRCTHTQQMFLWQFVIDFRPSAYERIPGRVWELLSTHRLRIRTREDYALTEEKPEPVRMAFDPMITLRMRIGLAVSMDMSLRQHGDDDENEEERWREEVDASLEEKQDFSNFRDARLIMTNEPRNRRIGLVSENLNSVLNIDGPGPMDIIVDRVRGDNSASPNVADFRRQEIFASSPPAIHSLGLFPLQRRMFLPVFSTFTTIRLALPVVEIMEVEISDQVSETLGETSFPSSPRNS